MPEANSSMNARVRGVVLLCSIFLVAALVSPALAYDEAEFDKAARTILCDCGCHPQSVADCACGRAAALREEMRAMIAGGMTGDEVIASYVAKHGEQILIAPDAQGFNLLAWVGPLALLLVGALGIVFLVRRWSARGASETDDAPRADLAPDDPYVSKLRRELEDLR